MRSPSSTSRTATGTLTPPRTASSGSGWWGAPLSADTSSAGTHRRLVVNVDGGARGNPGPAAAAAVATTPEGDVVEQRGERIGEATNNVAEYRAVLLGIDLARDLGASEVELIGDSELIVRQINGDYKVKDAGLKPLRAEVRHALEDFDDWSMRHVRREDNAAADLLVNETLDA